MYYKKCEHEDYSEEEMAQRKWLKFGSPSHEALKSVVMNSGLVKDVAKLNENLFTTHLEVFHALKIRYIPKSIFFEQEKMIAGVELAALDHNLNINRGQVIILQYCILKIV